MQTKKRNFKKTTAVTASVILILALLITGTFAYFGGQSALNIFKDKKTVDDGGVGRDDYEPGQPGKEVYVENKGKTNLYARIKLEEFMELNGIVIVGDADATRTPSDGWLVHKDAPDPSGLGETVIAYGTNPSPDKTAHDYWQWTLGGSKVYKPAPASAVAEDGTYNGDAYSDITDYSGYNASSAAELADLGLMKTPVGTVMTYEYWKNELNGEAGPYWVIDPEDGYIYWAQAIAPGEASGLLLKMVEGPQGLGEDDDWDEYYYAINVIFDFADEKDFSVIKDSANDKGKEILDAALEAATPPVPAESVTISGGDKTMAVGDTLTPSITIEPANSTDKPQWSSDNESVATVDPDTGKITAVAEGEAVITVTVGDKTDSITITVSPEFIPAENVTIEGGNKTMEVDDTYTPLITIDPADSTDRPVWSSSDESVATVDPDTGEITAVGEGDAVITVTVGAKSDSITITVAPGLLATKTDAFLNPWDAANPAPFVSSLVSQETFTTGKPEFNIDDRGSLEQCYGYIPLSIFLDDTSGVSIYSIDGLPSGSGSIVVGSGIDLYGRLNGADYSGEDCIIVKFLPASTAILAAMNKDAAQPSISYVDVTIKLAQTIGAKTQISEDITLRVSFMGFF
ncbi:MAG: Ig-like domain-containing protein [Clostridiales bacterium]|jgi:hypothetical protein|nr:Ig-like domain-containing protein [Clostridiales bacterium]MDR2712560.1 Ig-like domain-containing protein [Clostridiales bacterium]